MRDIGSRRSGWLGRLSRAQLAAVTAAATAIIVALLVIGATAGSGSRAPRNFGPAKNFSLSVLGHPRQHISLASLAGRPVIVNFFASWCPPCQRETPMIARFYRARHGRMLIIGIDANDQTAKALAFTAKSGVSYPVVTDPHLKTALAYRLPGLPATFFLSSRHLVVKRVYGAVTLRELVTGAAMISKRAG